MRVISDILVSRKPAIALMGSTGAPKSIKTTPRIKRVDPVELELTWQHDGVVFNGINKIVQSIMSAPHKLTAEDPKVLAYFENFVEGLGNSGSDITWNELLAQIFEHECIFGWAFIENVYNKQGNRIVDWDIIDPKKMDYAKDRMGNIVLDEFGKPVGFFEKLAYGTYHSPDDRGFWDVNREGIPKNVDYPAGFKAIFLKPDQVAIIKLFCVGDGFYPTGIIEPIYKTTLRKMNIEDSLANAIYRHGFPIMWAQLGDINHEPTPQHIESMLDKLKNISTKQEIATPYFYDIKILESKKFDKLAASLDYYINQQVAGLGIPKPFATGGGEATNRATLGNQASLFQLTLTDIIRRTIAAIEKYMFKPVAELEGFREVPKLLWEAPGIDQQEKKAKRILEWVKSGILKPDLKIIEFIKQMEDLE